ncbi:hypothetical protein [Colwellia hornerae]|uniref:Uncharacterized protein n=1 Tax=Colwellia hornerae TaxID=89402 RepID=A0A5C6QP51_9GAMM|nr:hypothetical protein [Colwellia hornerae]TWX56250.1 hypothetical protein ESZ28_05000 [Colwellia hornerae]TWX62101.1 hypothetical protein ESZ26_03775 [Colwellia hornerae]TWX70503.1 hypothetical protein ESZ27_03030 [Colwellia hornerae]
MFKVIVVLSISLFFIGCQSTSEKKSEEILETNKQTEYLSEAKVALDALSLDIEKSKGDKLSYFSPDIYEKAIEAYQDAFSYYTDIIANGHSSLSFSSKTEQYEEAKLTILTYISQANQQLKLAYSIRYTTETTLAKTFSQLQRLDELNVSTLYASDYKEITKEIDELVEMVAEGDVIDAQQQQPKLLTKMVAIEIRAVKTIELGSIEQKIEQIKDSRQDKYVPVSYQRLLMARNKANATITLNPRDVTNIKVAVDATRYELAHVYQLTNEVTKLSNINNNNYESYILNVENKLADIAVELGLGGIKDLSLANQVAKILSQSTILKRNLSSSHANVADLKGNSKQASTDLEKQTEHFSQQIESLNKENQLLEKDYQQLKVKSDRTDIALIKLQAYKDAIDSVNKAERVKAKIKNTVIAPKPLKNSLIVAKPAIKTLVSDDIDTAVSNDIEAVVVDEIDTAVSNDIEAVVVDEIDTAVSNDIEAVVVDEIDTAVSNDVEAVVVDGIDAAVSNDVEAVVVDDIDAAVSNDVEAVVSDGIDAAVSNKIEAVVSDGIDAAVSNEIEAVVVDGIDAAVSNDVEAVVVDGIDAAVSNDIETVD